MARDVDPMSLLVPGANRLGGIRVGLRARDVLVGVGLGDRFPHGLLWDLGNPPAGLVLVCEVHAVTLAHDRAEEIPVVMQGGVDVDGYPGHGLGTLGRCPSS